METFDSKKLEKENIEQINKFISSKKEYIENTCGNELIRDDIFPLLDKNCTVIYYPMKNEKNNGFHKDYIVDKTVEHFVYINTAQHKEKQIFTAAHELGHIWEIPKLIDKNCNIELEERIVNRFASELLMPQKPFIVFVKKELEKYLTDGTLVKGIDLLKVITSTMNRFFTSYKSVIYRFYEIGMLDDSSCRILWGETPELPRKVLIDFSKKIAQDNGYSRLYKVDERKWITGLKELLDSASGRNDFSTEWLQSFYTKFDLEEKVEGSNLEQTLSIIQLEEDV